ncbi:MAG: hypothetical protein EAX95_09420 [Candidatus Thorarchaeota archaeon]|nr:hypothetical protein [Candidatus Thorarchaeota archaeon]
MSLESYNARILVLNALDDYEESGKSIRYVLRRLKPEVDLTPRMHTFVRLRALGVVQFLNTIDFICVRALKRNNFPRLRTHTRNLLRLLTYETRWLGTKASEFAAFEDTYSGLESFAAAVASFNLETSADGHDQVGYLSVKYSHPSFLVRTFLDNMPPSDAIELLLSNNGKRNYYFRRNHLISHTDDSIQELVNSGLSFQIDEDIPDLFRVREGAMQLFKSDHFRKGHLLVQDKSSVMAARALNPHPGMVVWDACAAPGMKTHVLWEMMEKTGTLVATDIDSGRLELAKRRMSERGLRDVSFLVADAIKVPVSNADRILIDAPCSSTGTLRSHPSYKWRLNRKRLQAMMTIQNKLLTRIIEAYSQKPDTEVVYATCSLLPHEGESQIDSLLKTHRIELLDIPFRGSEGYPGFRCSEKSIRLFPHKHDCNGFFISRFRIADASLN